ncbi:MAG: methyltransferase domain-containing protein [Hyphomonas sp.]
MNFLQRVIERWRSRRLSEAESLPAPSGGARYDTGGGSRDEVDRHSADLGESGSPAVVLASQGECPTCCQPARFVARDAWLRDHFLCENCGSLPRERALMAVIEQFRPDWRDCVIHESSPAPRGASLLLARECAQYLPTQFYPGQTPGTRVDGVRCENLEALTFDDASIDLHITQDVFEHLFDPDVAAREIARTLKPGGMHIFTVPLVHRHRASVCRALRSPDGDIEYQLPPEYHGNPVSNEGSLVTFDWGFDICERLHAACGLYTHIVQIDDLSRGIRAELNEVLVTVRPS